MGQTAITIIMLFVDREVKVWPLDLRGCTYCELILKCGICAESAPMFTGRMYLLAGHHLRWFSAPVVKYKVFYFHTCTLFWDWLAGLHCYSMSILCCVSVLMSCTPRREFTEWTMTEWNSYVIISRNGTSSYRTACTTYMQYCLLL